MHDSLDLLCLGTIVVVAVAVVAVVVVIIIITSSSSSSSSYRVVALLVMRSQRYIALRDAAHPVGAFQFCTIYVCLTALSSSWRRCASFLKAAKALAEHEVRCVWN